MDSWVNNDGAPVPRRDWALFLDIDGTILDIAATPEAVVVPPELVPSLEAASTWLGGAMAVVSGRPLESIDRLLAPLALPCAAEHGAVVRLMDGSLQQPAEACLVPPAWLEHLKAETRSWDGVLIDPKSYSVALHYRLAPDRQNALRALAERLAEENSEFEVMPARMAYEIRHRHLNKGTAVRRLMQTPPFAGRVPVFVGDDVTDEDGIAAARELGGLGLHVAAVFGGQPDQVRAWLKRFAPQEQSVWRVS